MKRQKDFKYPVDYKFNKKICVVDKCNFPAWSNGLCKIHHSKYYIAPIKRENLSSNIKLSSTIKSSITSSKGLKNRTSKKIKFNYFGFNNQIEMFNHIWNTRPLVSAISKRPINYFFNTELWYNCFAHILPKGGYPHFRLNPDNIMLLHPKEHELLDHGTSKQQADYEIAFHCDLFIFENSKEKLKKQYNEFLNKNYG